MNHSCSRWAAGARAPAEKARYAIRRSRPRGRLHTHAFQKHSDAAKRGVNNYERKEEWTGASAVLASRQKCLSRRAQRATVGPIQINEPVRLTLQHVLNYSSVFLTRCISVLFYDACRDFSKLVYSKMMKIEFILVKMIALCT
jgi:hypothetical protein